MLQSTLECIIRGNMPFEEDKYLFWQFVSRSDISWLEGLPIIAGVIPPPTNTKYYYIIPPKRSIGRNLNQSSHFSPLNELFKKMKYSVFWFTGFPEQKYDITWDYLHKWWSFQYKKGKQCIKCCSESWSRLLCSVP